MWEAGILRKLKAIHAIPPVLAIVIVILWNLPRRQPADAPVTDTTVENAARPRTEISAGKPDGGRNRNKSLAADLPLDWRAVAACMRKSQQSTAEEDPPELEGYYERISEMTREQILDALDGITALGLDPEDMELLEEALVEPLIAVDPELALARFSNRIGDDPDGVGSQLSSALQGWAALDPVAATAWLDGQISAGRFESRSIDGQSEARIEFEAALAGELMPRDPAAAARRIEGLPQDQRAAAMEQMILSDLEPSVQKACVEIIRKLIPEDEREGPFARAVSELVPEGDFPMAEAFLDRIEASPEERAIAAELVASSRLDVIAEDRAIARQDVVEINRWLARQAPTAADRLTGEALGSAAEHLEEEDFSNLAALVLEVHRDSGNDEALAAFLSSSTSRPEQVTVLVENISDPGRRQEILDSLK